MVRTKTLIIWSSLAASATTSRSSAITLVRARTLGLTIRATFGVSSDDDLTLKMYYSPDGINWDTEAQAELTLTYSAGATVQTTIPSDCPEHGYVQFVATNESASDTVTNITLWVTVQEWALPAGSKGDISTKTQED